MADVRALLKAKRQEARINHPLASYNTSGQLRCNACGTTVKHVSAWEGHLGSKSHRTTVAQIRERERHKEEQRLKEEQEARDAASLGKRRAEEDEEMEQEDEHSAKKQKMSDSTAAVTTGGFPADFFSDPTRAPIISQDDMDEDDGITEQHPPPSGPVPEQPESELDLEFERFQREVVNARDYRDTYENATVMAEPVLHEAMEGIPSGEAEAEPEPELDEEELRRRKEQEERELIMDRLLDEERAQEEADMKVITMKNKLEALKQKRLAAKAKS